MKSHYLVEEIILSASSKIVKIIEYAISKRTHV